MRKIFFRTRTVIVFIKDQERERELSSGLEFLKEAGIEDNGNMVYTCY